MKTNILNKLIAKPGETHSVSNFDTCYTGELNKTQANALLEENRELLKDLQDKLYAQDQYAVLVIFQAMDAAGKDGTIKHVMSGINPQGFQVVSFKQPSSIELDHDYLWRIHKNIPERGRIGVFNRSHYEDVLVVKVHPTSVLKNKIPGIDKLEDIKESFWKRRYRQINDFEKYLVENGIHVVKFFLNVSKEEQEKRFLSRLENDEKNWKFSQSDIDEREYWDDYMKAFSDVLTYTSTKYAPWHVIPADHKWFMRYAVSEILKEEIQKLNPNYPVLSPEEKSELQEIKKVLINQKK